jgi:predicted transcriptional regulator
LLPEAEIGFLSRIIAMRSEAEAAVLITPELFDELSERERLLLAVRDGMADLEAGRVVEHEGLNVCETRPVALYGRRSLGVSCRN